MRDRDSARRRRLLLLGLGVAAVIAAGLGMVIGADQGEVSGDRDGRSAAASPTPRLPLPQAVGQTLVFAFDGTAAPEYALRRLRRGEGAGAILFAGNVAGPAQLRRLTGALQRAARGGALVMTDQEGGSIRRLRFAGPRVGQSQTATPDAARGAAAAAARALRAGGVNVNLAPVVDVDPPSGGGALPGRLYPGSPRRVAALATAALGAYERAGIAATAKHFPGLGRATVNTDFGAATVAASRATLMRTDLVPYRAAIDAGVPLVMAGHALYPAFDRRNLASQSRALMTGLLRRELGFEGVAITDSIEARAVQARGGVATAAVRSIAAGADIVLMTGSGSWNLVYPRMLRRARNDPAFAARVRESARRVLELKRRLGLRGY